MTENRLMLGNVSELFGYWPKFCDARICKFIYDALDRKLKLELKYIDNEKHVSAVIKFSFEGVIDIDLNSFLLENIIDEITILNEKAEFTFEIESCYGLVGQIKSKKIKCEAVPEED